MSIVRTARYRAPFSALLVLLLSAFLVACISSTEDATSYPAALTATPMIQANSSRTPGLLSSPEAISATTPAFTPTTGNSPTATSFDTQISITPLPVPDLTATPTTVASWEFPTPKFIAVQACVNVAHRITRCGIEVHESVGFELVYQLIDEVHTYYLPTFSPDGQWMAYFEKVERETQLRIVSTNWQNNSILTALEAESLQELQWSPNSQYIAFERYEWGSDEETAYVVEVATGELRLIEEHGRTFAWSSHDPTHFTFAVGQYSWEGSYIGFADGLTETQPLGGEMHPFGTDFIPLSLAWRPDESLIAVGITNPSSYQTELWFFDLVSGNWHFVKDFPGDLRLDMAWSPNGEQLAVYTGSTIFISESLESPIFKVIPFAHSGRTHYLLSAKWATDDVFVYALSKFEPAPSGQTGELVALSAQSKSKITLLQVNIDQLSDDYDSFIIADWFFGE